MPWQVWLLCSLRIVHRLRASLLLNAKQRGCRRRQRQLVSCGCVRQGKGKGNAGHRQFTGTCQNRTIRSAQGLPFLYCEAIVTFSAVCPSQTFQLQAPAPSKTSCHLSSLGQDVVGGISSCFSNGAEFFFLLCHLSSPGRFCSFLNFCSFGRRGSCYG